jgi:hypothetical protein
MNDLMFWEECENKFIRKVNVDSSKIKYSYFTENVDSFEKTIKLLVSLIR